ncbi:hypothetical protein HPB48_010805 [Haemaphysalis longicornis]|uniref:Uncharacterized protein n=1 Tax=Haemaphysalis longicornis TaxID=44386 RepID=A0A9J6G903_HAELO|nr:hypothetical protein HPB48_010805 [Haemaphysalis longicornis]
MHPILGKSVIHARGVNWRNIRSCVSYAFSSAKLKKVKTSCMLKLNAKNYLKFLNISYHHHQQRTAEPQHHCQYHLDHRDHCINNVEENITSIFLCAAQKCVSKAFNLFHPGNLNAFKFANILCGKTQEVNPGSRRLVRYFTQSKYLLLPGTSKIKMTTKETTKYLPNNGLKIVPRLGTEDA